MMSLPFLNHMPTLAGIVIFGSFGLMVMLLKLPQQQKPVIPPRFKRRPMYGFLSREDN